MPFSVCRRQFPCVQWQNGEMEPFLGAAECRRRGKVPPRRRCEGAALQSAAFQPVAGLSFVSCSPPSGRFVASPTRSRAAGNRADPRRGGPDAASVAPLGVHEYAIGGASCALRAVRRRIIRPFAPPNPLARHRRAPPAPHPSPLWACSGLRGRQARMNEACSARKDGKKPLRAGVV